MPSGARRLSAFHRGSGVGDRTPPLSSRPRFLGRGKTPVIGAVQRKGNVVARVLDHVTAKAAHDFVREVVSDKVSLLATDNWTGYDKLDKEYPRGWVDHSKRQYVVGAVHTNTIEGFWSLFKRGVVGTFHRVSTKYMPLYVAEFQFRYNTVGDVVGVTVGAPLVGAHGSKATTRAAPSVGDMVGAFKSLFTVEYIRGVKEDRWPAFDRRVWQRNYYEHIIRDEAELARVRRYIDENPLQWELDKENPQRVRP